LHRIDGYLRTEESGCHSFSKEPISSVSIINILE